jgi:HEAT repeat protein
MDAVSAVGALAHADKNLIPPLIDILKKDTHASVLSAATEALGEIGAEALPALVDLAKDKANGKKRRYAFEAIGYMEEQGKSALPVLTAALKETDPVVLRGAISALTRIGPDAKKAVPALVDALGDTLRDSAKPDSGGRFGTTSASINYLAFGAIHFLDPDLVGDLTAPGSVRFGKKKGFGGGAGPGGAFPGGAGPGGMTPLEFVTAWQQLHETLAKRYVERK